MYIKSFTFNDFQEHCYVVSNNNKEAIVIDPGFCYEKERVEFDNYIKENDLTIKHLINTHLHLDHIFGNKHIQTKYGVGAKANEKDEPLLENMKSYTSLFGLIGRAFTEKEFDDKLEALPLIKTLKDGDVVSIKDVDLKAIEIPGHTLGHLAFYNEQDACVFVGDILFRGGIGRTDLAGKDPAEMQRLLVDGIRNRLLVFPDETVVFSGHGPSTSIAEEKAGNMYLQ